jgi:F-type H+-transporting ATPase subunit a
MEEHESIVVTWVNEAFGLHLPPHVIMQTVILLFCFIFFGFLRTRFSVEAPGKLQQAFELFIEFLDEQLESNVGHGGHKYLNIIGTFAVFIVFCNLIGLVPGMIAPTSNVNVPAGCAVMVFLYYQYQGMKKQGVLTYLKHFMGPVLLLAPLMVPIEIIGHLARPATLTIRLFANIMAEEMVIVIFFGLIPLLVPLPFMAFAIFGSLLQAFIFCTLSMVYLGGAVATEEH